MRFRFDALEVSLDLVRSLRLPLERIRCRDRMLHDQVRSAASSIPLNLAEGSRRSGKDRLHFFRIAAGSAAELRAALRVAIVWGDLREDTLADAFDLLDRVRAMLWGLTR
jgi:four helix bundle protein